IALTYSWINSLDWLDLNAAATEFSSGQVNGVALCFAVAAMAKSANYRLRLGWRARWKVRLRPAQYFMAR
ncbi:MAG: hypothetical protein U1E13_08780, partial [Methylophilaceae bacterium]|nr:hypothetical protein [Methylophilaceae bacterium]